MDIPNLVLDMDRPIQTFYQFPELSSTTLDLHFHYIIRGLHTTDLFLFVYLKHGKSLQNEIV